jgi:hypothetical protein
VARGNDVYAARADGTIVRMSTGLIQQAPKTVPARPVGITVDSAGNVFVATAAPRIQKLSASLSLVAEISPTSTPLAIHAHDSANIYVAFADNTLRRYNGSLTELASGTPGGTPNAITSNSAGQAFVSTSAGVRRVSPAIGTTASADVSGLIGVDVDDAGHVVSADSAGLVQSFNTGLAPTGSYGSSVSPARAITVTSTGKVYIVGGPDGGSEGDPHIRTIDGLHYDFQAVGEFVLLRAENMEVQVRHAPVATTQRPGPDGYTGLAMCVSVNSAVAVRVGKRRITYQPRWDGQPDPSGMQLRIDGRIVAVPAEGLQLDTGVWIVPTAAPGGLEIDFADDSILYITPGWWASQGLWYLNVNFVPMTHVAGLMGGVPSGSWLPALPDGGSLGPMPETLHERYLILYGRFADAWRVNERTSLFDYAPGTSTASFTMRDWCSEKGDCTLPGATPAQPTTAEVAQSVCEQVVSSAAKANCVFDVMTTGDAGFATTYALAQNSQSRPRPVPCVPQPGSRWCSMRLLLIVIGVLAVLVVIVVVLRLRR